MQCGEGEERDVKGRIIGKERKEREEITIVKREAERGREKISVLY